VEKSNDLVGEYIFAIFFILELCDFCFQVVLYFFEFLNFRPF